MLQQIAFIALVTIAVYLFSKKIGSIKRNILLGKEEDLNNQKTLRWKNVLLLALGQKKMFKNPLVACLHLVIYAGFIIINLEIIEIILDGILGTHRLFLPYLGVLYGWLINSFEALAVGVIVVCIIFLIRRNIIKLQRFASKDLNGWPRSDANYILITEIVLMCLFLTMNATDALLHPQQSFVCSSLLHPLFAGSGSNSLEIIERICWWVHITGILAFLNYLPYSKHLHIILAFPNAYYARLIPAGKLNNMPSVQNEVLYAMKPKLAPADAPPPARFGAKDVTDLSWKSLLDAYSCTECGRCTSACPANMTGKLLSPRTIMMKTRDRVEEVGRNIDANKQFVEDGKSLLRDYISEEELHACTTCNACGEACPVSISPLDIIMELRRNLIMEESSAPQEWNATFSNIENNFAPWKFSPEERGAWAATFE